MSSASKLVGSTKKLGRRIKNTIQQASSRASKSQPSSDQGGMSFHVHHSLSALISFTITEVIDVNVDDSESGSKVTKKDKVTQEDRDELGARASTFSFF